MATLIAVTVGGYRRTYGGTVADPSDGGAQEVEREAMFFAVLRERTRPVDPLSRTPAALPAVAGTPSRYEEADREISEWLEEAEDEGRRILDQARAEAARLRLEAHEQAERLRQAAERAATEAARDRDRLLRQADVEASQAQAAANARAAELLREAAEEAATLYADRVAHAEREATWLRTQAESDARALQSHAAATVQALQADVGVLRDQLAALVEHASQLLPALDAAAQSPALGPGRATTLGGPAVQAIDAAEAPDDRGLGRLVELLAEEQFDAEGGGTGSTDADASTPTVTRRRPLGRLLRRT